MNKVIQKPWHSFRILPNVSMKYCSMSIVKTLLMYKVCITKRPREILQRLTDFWIKKNDILRLFECLELSQSTGCYQKSRCNRIVALRILLKRLSNHADAKTWSYYLSEGQLDFIWYLHSIFFINVTIHRLESWDLFFVQPPYLQR